MGDWSRLLQVGTDQGRPEFVAVGVEVESVAVKQLGAGFASAAGGSAQNPSVERAIAVGSVRRILSIGTPKGDSPIFAARKSGQSPDHRGFRRVAAAAKRKSFSA